MATQRVVPYTQTNVNITIKNSFVKRIWMFTHFGPNEERVITLSPPHEAHHCRYPYGRCEDNATSSSRGSYLGQPRRCFVSQTTTQSSSISQVPGQTLPAQV